MREMPLSKDLALQYLRQEIMSGTNCAAGEVGVIKGWRQMEKSVEEMMDEICRYDACGRMSNSDMRSFHAAVLLLQAAEELGPVWAGYLTIR